MSTSAMSGSGWVVVGHCPRCGAPIYAPAAWHGTGPPPSNPSCGCSRGSHLRVVVTPSTGTVDTAGKFWSVCAEGKP